MGRVGEFGLKGTDDHASIRVSSIVRGVPDRGLVPKTFRPMLGEAPPPLANHVRIDSHAGRHNLTLLAVCTGQDDPGS
jgi:hypothetical protein